METKLTLKLDKTIIEKAKVYASSQNRSLSKLIEAYLMSITSKSSKKDDIEISSFVKSMSSRNNIPVDLDYKKEFTDYLIEKHK